jgi:hypothetical protein
MQHDADELLVSCQQRCARYEGYVIHRNNYYIIISLCGWW